MQDNSRQLRGDSKGVADLPIKLIVVMVILSVTIPIVVQSADDGEKSMIEKEMGQDIERILNASSVVYYSGADSSRSLEMQLPDGCEISVGGNGTERFELKSIYNGELLSTSYFEKPPIEVKEKIILSGHCTLVIKNIGNNEMEFSVS